jgi:hypothetical protein
MNFNRAETSLSYHQRNLRALAIFNQNGYQVRIIGDDESPMFILEDRCLLSCFINGNDLFFRLSPDSAEIVHRVNLSKDVYLTKFELTEIMERCEHLPVFRIMDITSQLYLVGFNRLTSDDDEIVERFPVFGRHKPLVYINPDKVDSVADELRTHHYSIEVI